MHSRITSLIAASALAVAACQPTTAPTQAPANDGDPLRVVATFSVLGDLVQNVGREAIDLTVLVGPDGDAHTFEPSPSDGEALAKAQVIVEIGVEFETWLDSLIDASGSTAARVVAAEDIDLIPAREAHGHEGEEGRGDEQGTEEPGHSETEEAGHGENEHAEGAHEHGDFDPHVWQSVPNAILIVRNIQAGLSAADPENAASYQANADAYVAQLNELQTYITEQVGALPVDGRKLVTNHDAIGYYCRDYGLTLVGDLLGSVTTEGAEPSASDVAAIIESIRAEQVKAIFLENIGNSAVAEQIATEAGVVVGGALYTDALGAPGTPGDTYLNMMRHNTDTIVAALR
jgi:ABC-type Zn uptake system ZnuABC Zn-binding protein ZnuA